jgi:hypothetical protein
MNLTKPRNSAGVATACIGVVLAVFVVWAQVAQADDGEARVTSEDAPFSDVAQAVDTHGGDADAVIPGSESIHPWDNNDTRDTTVINGVIQLPGSGSKGDQPGPELDISPLSKTGATTSKPDNIGDVGNFPNPFNAQTQIRFTLKSAGDVEVQIFNLLGQTVRQVRLAGLTAGSHSWVWDGRVHRGGNAPSGVYFYRVESGGSAAIHRMVLLK